MSRRACGIGCSSLLGFGTECLCVSAHHTAALQKNLLADCRSLAILVGLALIRLIHWSPVLLVRCSPASATVRLSHLQQPARRFEHGRAQPEPFAARAAL